MTQSATRRAEARETVPGIGPWSGAVVSCDPALAQGLVRALRDDVILPADYAAAAAVCRDCAAPAQCGSTGKGRSGPQGRLPPACCANAPLFVEVAQI